jgi:hypothetical protein
MSFVPFSTAIKAKFEHMAKSDLFEVEVDKDVVWNLYLDSFPEGTNDILKERRFHDCNCCKGFVRRVGNVVSIKNGVVDSIWNVEADHPYAEVAAILHDYVTSLPIKTVFLSDESKVGAAVTRGILEGGGVASYNHFVATIPAKFVDRSVAATRGAINTAVGVFKRGLEELRLDAMDTVIDLINSDSIYRGAEFKKNVVAFRKMVKEYSLLNSDEARNLFIWSNATNREIRFRNTVIGTLVDDISTGIELEKAVRSFESKVAPTNYKRSSSLITPAMVKDAMKTVDTLGIGTSLKRRFATVDDVRLENVLFADRTTKPLMKDADDLTDLLMNATVTPATKLAKTQGSITEIAIEDFVKNILPTADSMEVMVSNKHLNNLMSVVGPSDEDAKNIFTWDNKFSWSYNNNTTDSIKGKVQRAGGNVNAVLRTSLSWFNYDDLDIHVIEPNGNHVHYGNKGNKLDVDMNVGSNTSRDAVENVSWTAPATGNYQVYINNFTKRETIDVGFIVEMECNGTVSTFSYKKPVSGNQKVMDFTYDGRDVTITKVHPNIEVDSAGFEQEEWGVTTEKFSKVNMMMLSPNHWDEQKVGNKHYFFILDECLNPEPTRGIYNEFLGGDLTKHRKVFEIIGDKTKCEMTDTQLSGVGFSSTKREEMFVRISGRVMKLKF